MCELLCCCQVEQGKKEDELAVVFKGKCTSAASCMLTQSGDMVFLDSEMQMSAIRLWGCLSSRDHDDLKMKMDKQVEDEVTEIHRIEIKNSFEDTLRRVLSNKVTCFLMSFTTVCTVPVKTLEPPPWKQTLCS